MSYLKSIKSDAVMLEVFKASPAWSVPLLDIHEALLRGPSPFTVAQRELMAAFVSGLNACRYCHGVHGVTAQRFGVAAPTLEALLENIDTAAIDAPLRPVFRLIQKLTLTPARVELADAQAVFDAGWSEQALTDAVGVCSLFNFMNRFVDGLGIEADEAHFDAAADRLATGGYAGLKDLIGPSDPQA